jgi:hypothetical protein
MHSARSVPDQNIAFFKPASKVSYKPEIEDLKIQIKTEFSYLPKDLYIGKGDHPKCLQFNPDNFDIPFDDLEQMQQLQKHLKHMELLLQEVDSKFTKHTINSLLCFGVGLLEIAAGHLARGSSNYYLQLLGVAIQIFGAANSAISAAASIVCANDSYKVKNTLKHLQNIDKLFDLVIDNLSNNSKPKLTQ